MGFESFFSKKPAVDTGVSPELYPASKAMRDNWDRTESHAHASAESFDKKSKRHLHMMFGPVSREGVRSAELTESEETDVKNFIAYASKRLAFGAISSKMYHKQKDALQSLAPEMMIGHDCVHAMMAYARTQGKSLVPAYMKIEDKKILDQYKDKIANQEETYVNGFSNLDEVAKMSRNIVQRRGLRGEELVLATVEAWEDSQIHKKDEDKHFLGDEALEHRLPEFVTVVRNLINNLEQEHPDPSFAVHEFQRILAPLLERLRSSDIVK
jgi:hypothetical protein